MNEVRMTIYRLALAGMLTGFASGQPAQPLGTTVPLARVGDITNIQGQGINRLNGYGLVVGLAGTGDGDGYIPTMHALAQFASKFGAPDYSLDALKGTKNAAIVSISVTVPETGAREGELLDVTVSAWAAKSLAGGRLLPVPMTYEDRTVGGLFAFAQGPIEIPDEQAPTRAVIRHGARMERDVFMNVVSTGDMLASQGFGHPWIEPGNTYITLVLNDSHAGWPMAAAVAEAIDTALGLIAGGERVALALDAKNVAVLVPESHRANVSAWIRDVETASIFLDSNEARVTINRQKGTIVITGDTRLSPVVVSQRGMTITVFNGGRAAGAPQALIEQQDFVGLPEASQAPANVRELLEALNQLKTPFEDRVAILEEIHRAGKLHARLMYEQ